MKKIIMAVPKGRILNELNPLLKKTGIIPEDDFFRKDSRKLMFETNLNFNDRTINLKIINKYLLFT